jgi:amidase
MPTTYGAALYRDHRPARAAALVTRLRRAGAIILGKTVTTEFAYAAPGPTRNPHDTAHTPGGSSSGSAAAVAAGMAGLAISSQTGGSTIRPAAFCGVVGFKPTHGLIDSSGMKALAPSSDTVGLHARSVADIALAFDVLADGAAPSTVGAPIRIAWFPGPHAAAASSAAVAALGQVRHVLEQYGMLFAMPDIAPADVAALGECNSLIMAVEGAHSLEPEYRLHRERLATPTQRLIETGRAVPAERYREALEFVERHRIIFDAAMTNGGFDALLSFSAPGVAPLAADGAGNSLFNRPWSALGAPCLSLPCGFSAGLPLGVQLVARRGADLALLALGSEIERWLAQDQSITG